jgi:hypothetical protein
VIKPAEVVHAQLPYSQPSNLERLVWICLDNVLRLRDRRMAGISRLLTPELARVRYDGRRSGLTRPR